MRVLRGILQESSKYYRRAMRDLKKELVQLPIGSVKRRKIGKRIYYYLQYRQGKKVVHKYIGKEKPDEILDGLKRKFIVRNELKKAKEAVRILSKIR